MKRSVWALLGLICLLFVGMPWMAFAQAPKAILRFAHLSDNHYMVDGPDGSWRLLHDSPALLADALEQVNQAGGIQFVLFTGDFVNLPKPENFDGFFNTLQSNTKIPAYLALGNHDVGIKPNQTKLDTLKILHQHQVRGFTIPDKGYYSFSPVKQVQWIILDGTTDARLISNGFIPEEELLWLKSELEKAKDKTVFVALHFPVIEPFPSKSHCIVQPDATKLLTLLEQFPNVSAVFTGHYHSARVMKQNKILYFSAPSLIEYPNAFRLFTVYDDGTIQAEWKETGLISLQKRSHERSPWPLNASGDPTKDHNFKGPLRFFPKEG